MAQLGTLPEPVEPKCSHKLAGTIPSDTTGDPRPPKSNPNGSHICHQASTKTSIQASIPRVQQVGGRGGSVQVNLQQEEEKTKPQNTRQSHKILDKALQTPNRDQKY